MSTLYQVLNISNTATRQDIRKAYLKLALKYHPDKSNKQNTTQKFRRISKAYQILSNTKKRKLYDTRLEKKHKLSTEFNFYEYTQQMINDTLKEIKPENQVYADLIKLFMI